ncbi:putative benzoate 4-monooxygenase cytochrome P450 [Macrophomina phaseolina]|uniref:Benzoate 4-monooxygenase cytochrome P450 n=1 Tax=Macrophomina phaseolina TaxID=35725 RepID=A0ABQ8GDA8_9PEZI|nr:putative benzoate 4-monooxygenase cytochrome P450 [Macrophomina phaseolina]
MAQSIHTDGQIAALPPAAVVTTLLVIPLAGYIVYQRLFHPLARFPGPFLASLTDLWQCYQFLTLKQPYNLTELHAKYGNIVRYGPNKLSVTSEDAVQIIYQKGGRLMPKSEMYVAFGTGHPNSFAMRDEAAHSIRRRHMSHSFSSSYVKEMEGYLDINIKLLKDKIASRAERNEAFDLKKLLDFYIFDVLGELAFSQSFNTMPEEDESRMPPVKENTLLGVTTGSWTAMAPLLRDIVPKIPIKVIRDLVKGRVGCGQLAVQCVQRRLEALKDIEAGSAASSKQRKDLLTNLILARHPDTGEKLAMRDLVSEAFGFIIAGTHTTSATQAILFWYLLHNSDIMEKCVAEIDASIPPLNRPSGQHAYTASDVEASLPYLRQCIRENFRISPVFTMPMERKVMAAGGVTISGQHIPQGTNVAICSHAYHHNPDIWGSGHEFFDPARWDKPELNARARYLMHFGLGGRQCIGKTVAQTNLYKLSATLLREFTFELADPQEKEKVEAGFFRGKTPEMVSMGISELEHPLMVKAKPRD